MTFVIAGVSGHTGKAAAESLLASGKSIRVIVRDAAKGAEWKARGAEVAVADLNDASAVARALDGATAAYLLVPPLFAPGFSEHQKKVTAALASAIETSRVPHVVFLSSVGAQHPAGTGVIAGLHHAEQALKAISTTAFTFIRAAYFMENLGGSLGQVADGVLPSFLPADLGVPMIAAQDIGRLAAAELVEGPRGNQVIELESGLHSNREVAATLSTILGRTVAVQEAPATIAAQVLASMGFPADLAALYQEMLTGIASGHVAFEGGHRRATGSTSLESVLRGLLGK